MPSASYVHGYSPRESLRLNDQAQALTELLHGDEMYPPGALVLEAGCGTGAQTVILARRNPSARFVSVDRDAASLERAHAAVARAGLTNVSFQEADLRHLPHADGTFAAVFVCFVLEHLRQPEAVLRELYRVLRPAGAITAIEGDHGSAYFHPDSALARTAIRMLVALQKEGGGDALIGRRLYPLMRSVGFGEVRVTPRVVYADASRPALVDGFTRNTFTAMVEGVGEEVRRRGWMSAKEWRQAIEALRHTAGPDGVFNYTFFKAKGIRPAARDA